MATPATFLRMDENGDEVRSEREETRRRGKNPMNIHAAFDRSLGEFDESAQLAFRALAQRRRIDARRVESRLNVAKL
jgi:hypothetical protein